MSLNNNKNTFRISLRSSSTSFYRLINSFLTENKVLNLSEAAQITEISFQILTRYSLKLRHLNLRGCIWVTDNILRPVLRNNPSLRSIDLSFCNNCTEGVLHTITMMCTAITTLRLGGCNWVNTPGLELGCSENTLITIFIYARVDFGVFQYGKLGSSLKKMIFGLLVHSW
jgi:hypothetical protein